MLFMEFTPGMTFIQKVSHRSACINISYFLSSIFEMKFGRVNPWDFLKIFHRFNIRYDNVTLIPLVLQLGLRIGHIQRMGAN